MNIDFEEINLSSFKNANINSKICESCIRGKINKTCPKFLECPFQRRGKGNVIVNTFDNANERELVFYKKPFYIPAQIDSTKEVDRSRKFYIDSDGFKVPKNDNVSINDYLKTKNKSRKRAVDNIFGYCINNDWDYFITLTFDNNKVDRNDRKAVGYKWKLFRQKLQYRFSNFSSFLISERHSLGGIHFHGLVGGCDLSKYLRIAINKNLYLYKYVNNEKVFLRDKDGNLIKNKYYLQPLKTEFGDQVYNIDSKIYNDGYLTIVKIRHDSSNRQLINYLNKYITKDCFAINDNLKTYFRTHNLKAKDKNCSFKTKDEFDSICFNDFLFDEWSTTNIKETDKLISVKQVRQKNKPKD